MIRNFTTHSARFLLFACLLNLAFVSHSYAQSPQSLREKGPTSRATQRTHVKSVDLKKSKIIQLTGRKTVELSEAQIKTTLEQRINSLYRTRKRSFPKTISSLNVAIARHHFEPRTRTLSLEINLIGRQQSRVTLYKQLQLSMILPRKLNFNERTYRVQDKLINEITTYLMQNQRSQKAPKIEIISPTPDQKTSSSNVLIQIKSNAKVDFITLNDKRAMRIGQSQFRQFVKLKPGENRIIVRAVKLGQVVAEKTITVRHTAHMNESKLKSKLKPKSRGTERP